MIVSRFRRSIRTREMMKEIARRGVRISRVRRESGGESLAGGGADGLAIAGCVASV